MHKSSTPKSSTPKSSMFKSSMLFALALLCCAPVALAAEPAPSEPSLRELMQVTRARDTIDTMLAQMDTAMKASMRQVTDGEQLSPAQRELVDQMSTEFVALFRDEMTWDKLEPDMLEVYRTSFTQAEVDGMLDFYRSDVGQAVIAKMPVVLQNSMKLTQGRLGAIMPKVQALQKEYAAKIAAAK